MSTEYIQQVAEQVRLAREEDGRLYDEIVDQVERGLCAKVVEMTYSWPAERHVDVGEALDAEADRLKAELGSPQSKKEMIAAMAEIAYMQRIDLLHAASLHWAILELLWEAEADSLGELGLMDAVTGKVADRVRAKRHKHADHEEADHAPPT